MTTAINKVTNYIGNTAKILACALPVVGALYNAINPSVADASESRVTTSTRAYHALPLPEKQSLEGLTNVHVSAEIQVRHDQYDIQGPTPFEYRVDVNACRDVEKDGKTECVPERVLGYELIVRATPARKESRNDPRDDPYLAEVTKGYNKPTVLNGTEFHYKGIKEDSGIDRTVMLQFQEDGDHFVYTEGIVYVPGKDEKGKVVAVAMPIPGLHSDQGPSYDTVNITGTKGVKFYYSTEDINAWKEQPFLVTTGGIFKPRWDHTFEPDLGVLYKAGPHWGRKFGFVASNGYYDDGEQKDRAICDEQWKIPCLAMYERTLLLGVEKEKETKNKDVLRANGVSDGRHVAEVGRSYAARYGKKGDATPENWGTWNFSGGSIDEFDDGSYGLQDRVVNGVHIPPIAGLGAMERVLLMPVGIDTNNDGAITLDEIKYLEATTPKIKFVQFAPKGHELEAFITGAALGAATNLIPRATEVETVYKTVEVPADCDDCDDNAIFTPGTQTSPVQ